MRIDVSSDWEEMIPIFESFNELVKNGIINLNTIINRDIYAIDMYTMCDSDLISRVKMINNNLIYCESLKRVNLTIIP